MSRADTGEEKGGYNEDIVLCSAGLKVEDSRFVLKEFFVVVVVVVVVVDYEILRLGLKGYLYPVVE